MLDETKALHLEEQVELELQKKQVKCMHEYRFKGEVGKYYSYTCKKCLKVYWVEPYKDPNKE